MGDAVGAVVGAVGAVVGDAVGAVGAVVGDAVGAVGAVVGDAVGASVGDVVGASQTSTPNSDRNPAGQFLQRGAPCWSWKVPPTHAVHSDMWAEGCIKPLGQLVQAARPDVAVNCPAGHSAQRDCPASAW